jgi:hypothetical protein
MDYFLEECGPVVLFHLRFADVGRADSTMEIWSRAVAQSVQGGDTRFGCESTAIWPSVEDQTVLKNAISCIWQLTIHNVEARVNESPPVKFSFRYTDNDGNTVIQYTPEMITAHIRTLILARLPDECDSQEAEELLCPIDSLVFMDRA